MHLKSTFCLLSIVLVPFLIGYSQTSTPSPQQDTITISTFWDSSHHWYDITDDDKVITALPNQPRYKPTEIGKIADNILLYQKTNGGWPKNYDMLAILTEEQKQAVLRTKEFTNTTFDNGTTHAQVEYLAQAYAITKEARHRDACLSGIDFILSAQYPNGGWPQFYPEMKGYSKYITFNDGAMIGVMKVLHRIVQDSPQYSFVDMERREKVRKAFGKGIDCILKCQIAENGVKSVWCQQHDEVDFHPQNARTFELASICNGESSEITLFLMSLDHPSKKIIDAVQSAVQWFEQSVLHGVTVKTIAAPTVKFKYRTSSEDRIVVQDSTALPIWTRFYELGSHRSLFCGRDGKPLYSLAEVERERRSGYSWYTYAPAEVLKKYPAWLAQQSAENVREGKPHD